ncbi:hypothetical protein CAUPRSCDRAFT_13039, partial [Caulochytrium protostelioides]
MYSDESRGQPDVAASSITARPLRNSNVNVPPRRPAYPMTDSSRHDQQTATAMAIAAVRMAQGEPAGPDSGTEHGGTDPADGADGDDPDAWLYDEMDEELLRNTEFNAMFDASMVDSPELRAAQEAKRSASAGGGSNPRKTVRFLGMLEEIEADLYAPVETPVSELHPEDVPVGEAGDAYLIWKRVQRGIVAQVPLRNNEKAPYSPPQNLLMQLNGVSA